MVCIIDDREDVWKMANNLVHVRPYRFFVGTADINAPPEASKAGAEPAFDEASGNINKTIRHAAKIVRVPKQKVSQIRKAENRESFECVSDTVGQSDDKLSEVEAGTVRGEIELTNQNIVGIAKEESAPCDADAVKQDNIDAQEIFQTRVFTSTENEVNAENIVVTDEYVKQTVMEKPVDDSAFVHQDLVGADPQEETIYNSSQITNTPIPADGNDEELEYEELIEWEDADDYLIYLEEILTRIHTVYYKFYDEMQHSEDGKVEIPDLKTVVPYVRRKVLKGAYIVFSGVCPLDTDMTKSRIYRVAESLGAVIQQSVVSALEDENPITTHLIAARLGTQKTKAAARCKSIRIVNPDWLWDCADRWEWVDERLYPLNEDASSRFLSRDSPDPMKSCKRMKDLTDTQDKINQALAEIPSSSKINKNNSLNVLYNNPLFAFSKEDISGMDAEVEEQMDETDSDKDDDLDCKKQPAAEKLNEDYVEKIETEEDMALREKVLSTYGKKRNKCDGNSTDEDADSLCADFPKGWKLNGCKRAKGNEADDDADDNGDDGKTTDESDALSRSGDDEDFNESVGSIDDEIAAAVEREFLS